MGDPLLDKKRAEAKNLLEKLNSIPENKNKQRAIVMSKLSEIKRELDSLKRFNDSDAKLKQTIQELETVYATGKMTIDKPKDWYKFTSAELEHHLKRCKEKLSGKRI
jgi:hypothetical protein